MPNKKNTRQKNHSGSNSNVEAFLAYCAYDVRWNVTGNHPRSTKNASRTFLKEAKGETPSQHSNNPVAGEGKTMKSK